MVGTKLYKKFEFKQFEISISRHGNKLSILIVDDRVQLYNVHSRYFYDYKNPIEKLKFIFKPRELSNYNFLVEDGKQFEVVCDIDISSYGNRYAYGLC